MQLLYGAWAAIELWQINFENCSKEMPYSFCFATTLKAKVYLEEKSFATKNKAFDKENSL